MVFSFYRMLALLMSLLMSVAAFITAPEKEHEVKNVILFIGDGMGPLHLDMTEELRDVELAMNTMPQQGFSMTYSANKAVTDSSAGATAIACGVKTANGVTGLYWTEETGCIEDEYPQNITEYCRDIGMKTGVVTTDELYGGTPGAFTAHTTSRKNYDDILSQQLASGFDIIWGRDTSRITAEDIESAGYTYISTIDEMNSLTGNEKSIGMFTARLYHTYNKNDYTPTLSQMTESAIGLLDTDNENGFFLMVEGAHIDKRSHDQDEEGAAEALEEFDNAIEIALQYAEIDGDTLVIVTADHETGHLYVNENGEYEMPEGNHSGVNVPIRAYGPYDFIGDGEIIENTEIHDRIIEALLSDDEAESESGM